MHDRLTVGELFAGIGGMSLGLERAGFDTRWFCERDAYRQRVLARHWPGRAIYDDVCDLHDPEPVAVLTAGFPCQPVSFAGHGRVQTDERWLWPEIARLIRVLRPGYVLLENVAALLAGRGASDVFGDLAALGMDIEWDCIPASAVGAPHRRDRVWIVAYPNADQAGLGGVAQRDGQSQQRPAVRDRRDADGLRVAVADAHQERRHRGPRVFGPRWRDELADCRRRMAQERGAWWSAEPGMGRVAHGVPDRAYRLAALGDSLVPVIPELVGRCIIEWERSAMRAAA